MNVASRTLKLVVDGHRGGQAYLSEVGLRDRIESAGEAASETVSVDAERLDPTALADHLAAVVDDEQFVERLEEADSYQGLAAGASAAVAEALARQIDADAATSALPDDTRKQAATAFITALQRELVSTDTPMLVDIGNTVLQDGNFETAESYLELSREIAREVDDSAAEAAALVALGDGTLRSGHTETAEEYYRDGLDIAREIDDSTTEAAALAGIGNVALAGDDDETAEASHRECLELARAIGDRSTEANSLASLGTIAGNRGEFEQAEQYLETSLDIKRQVGDEVGEATVLASLGNVAADRGPAETAVEYYTEAAARFAATDQPRERIQTLQNLIAVERERGNSAAAIDYCNEGLALLAETDLSGLDEVDRWFRTTRPQLTGDPDDVEGLYRTALDRISEDDDPAAFELLSGVWDCRECFEPGTETYGLCLRGGVGFAAYHLLIETDAVETTHTDICATISTHREALSEPAETLFEFVTSGGGDRDAEISVDSPDGAADSGGDGEPSTDVLERDTYAAFLSRITETPPPSELYSQALTGVVSGDRDPREVVQLCLVAWQQREDVPEDSRAILGSLLLAEAHRERFEFDLPTDRAETFDRIADSRSTLSEPMAGLFDRLATGSTEATPQTLLDAADSETPSVIDVERMAVARFLEALRR